MAEGAEKRRLLTQFSQDFIRVASIYGAGSRSLLKCRSTDLPVCCCC